MAKPEDRDYRKEYDRYHASKKAKIARAKNNAANIKAKKEGRITKGSNMGIGAVFNVTQLKDTSVKHRHRVTGRMNRIDEFGNEEV